ncbi:hypothetical protein JJE66_24235 [Bradyrhizobium diazoefficiens]|uniref:hypothetical protein n=1 Tax=Bradyrhizobium diazoefficiens TaxID=1355477 RepID=UPI00190BE92E|nr:hypothetical protein [Bradyrhizobium diazoefficiens]MBK3664320.1 hypothetical protein [Bradyrhizobium diazoefficiens]
MELGGQIFENRQRYDELSHQMRHVEDVIKLLDPAYNLARITVKRRQPNKWFKRGTLYRRALDRRALDVLRTATEPMTTTELANGVLAAHGVQDASKDDVLSIALGIQHSLKNHEGKGVERIGEGNPARWMLRTP